MAKLDSCGTLGLGREETVRLLLTEE